MDKNVVHIIGYEVVAVELMEDGTERELIFNAEGSLPPHKAIEFYEELGELMAKYTGAEWVDDNIRVS